jgi:hypothetical protein
MRWNVVLSALSFLQEKGVGVEDDHARFPRRIRVVCLLGRLDLRRGSAEGHRQGDG